MSAPPFRPRSPWPTLAAAAAFLACAVGVGPAARGGPPATPGPGATFEMPRPPLRTGLLEALSRRASYTRAHRGALAAVRAGEDADGSEWASAFYTEERVYFAWHQPPARVVVAAFSPAGKLVLGPIALGSGRWPRVVAAGERVAVVWEEKDASAARVLGGGTWTAEIPLAGLSPAPAFSPADGSLLVATTRGLFRLENGIFSAVRDLPLVDPALAVDAGGSPHVAARDGASVQVDGETVGEGAEPALLAAGNDQLDVAFVSKDGALVLRTREGGSWGPPRTVAPLAESPRWPALARGAGEGASGGDGLRITYRGRASPGPDAVWLVRLPLDEGKPALLLPSLAPDVTSASLLLRFQIMGGSRWGYRPHDVRVSVNGDWVKWFRDTIPEGRYWIPLDPSRVLTSSGRPAYNQVAVDSWHMNGGHYMTSTDYTILTRTAWGESFAFAADEQEARVAANRPTLDHDRPDLAILANGMDLPPKPPATGTVPFTVVVANLGEGPSRPAGLAMLAETGGGPAHATPLARLDVPALAPRETFRTVMELEGRPERIDFHLEQATPDFDPTNDSLALALWPREVARQAAKPTVRIEAPATARITAVDGDGRPVELVVRKDGRVIAPAADARGPRRLAEGSYRIEAEGFDVPLEVKPGRGYGTKSPLAPDALAREIAWLSHVVVNTNNANLMLVEEDGEFRRWYNSRSLFDGPLGFGWTFAYGERLGRTPEGLVTVLERDGYVSRYRPLDAEDGGHAVDAPFPSRLVREDGKVVRLLDAEQFDRHFGEAVARQEFARDGRLLSVELADGSRRELAYDGDRLASVRDPATGRALLTLTGDGAGHVSTLVDAAGRTFRYELENGLLVGVTGPKDARTEYTYSRGRNLTGVSRPGGSHASFSYDESRDWVTAVDAGDLSYSLRYGQDTADHLWTIQEDPDGTEVRWDFAEKSGLTLVTTVAWEDGEVSPLR